MPNPIITAALTGPVATKADNPGMPGAVAEIAADAKAAYDAGAAVIHIHLRDDDGNMTVDLDVARRTVEAVRAERHRARVQGGHGRLGLDHLHAVLVREGEAARGQLDNAEADG